MRPVSGKHLCKVLERKGWTLVRIHSSYHIYTSPDGTVTVSVPVHGNRTLPTGTQHGIMKQAGLTDADL
ncbi:MAG: type II toxin-antitoxin system HicA family toxin [Planctomycetes bacterium]|nr:type II toxin-antitoxin system HicA family toxin [Planctomycetota bacterium]